MSAALIAVSVGDSIVKFGAYAGYASIIGLGVLSLLYFAQAREVKRLREWAGRSPERDAELAQRVQTDAQRRVVAQPLSPATTAAQQAEAARTAAAAALYAKIPAPPPPPPPLVGQPGQLARPVAPGAVPGTAPAMPAAGATTTPAPGSVPGAMTPAPGSVPGAMTPAPGSVPGAMTPAPGSVPGAMTPAPGSVPGATAITPGAAAAAAAASASRSTSVLGNGSGGQETHESDAARPDPAEAPFSRDSFSADDDEGGFGFSPGRTGAIIGGAVAAVLVAVVLMVALTRDNPPAKPNQLGVVTTPATSSPASGGSSATTTASSPAAVDRRATRVAVLNGTTQTGLARTVADEVEKARFTISATETNADQTVRTTTVSYGSGSQRAAQIIAQVLGINGGSVQPVDPSASAAADADVVVIVGADKIG